MRPPFPTRFALAIVAFITMSLHPASADVQDTLRQLVDPVPREPHPAVGRIVVSEQDAMSKGSGTLIDVYRDYGVVLTNWHVVRDASGPIQVTFSSGFQAFAQVLQTNETWDLAALKIPRPPIEPMRMASTIPIPGSELTIAGYGSGQYRAARGKCTQYCAPDQNSPFEMVEASVAARHGDSGGPMVNSQGELAGVLFGAARGTTSGTHIGRVYWFVAPILQRLRAQSAHGPSTMIASTSAPPNRAVTTWNGAAVLPDPYYPAVASQPAGPRPGQAPGRSANRLRPARSPLANYSRYAKKMHLSNDRRDLLGKLPVPNEVDDESRVVVTSPHGTQLPPPPTAPAATSGWQPATLPMQPTQLASASLPAASQPPHLAIASLPNTLPPDSHARSLLDSLPSPQRTLSPQISSSQASSQQLVTLGELAGDSPWDKLKSAFALVGVIFVFDQLMRVGVQKKK